jgi:hypothetical protein
VLVSRPKNKNKLKLVRPARNRAEESGVAGQPQLVLQASLLPTPHFVHIMTEILYSRSLLRASRAVSSFNGTRPAIFSFQRRGFADVTTDDMTLPLKGYKVLDMTRVLAGVCCTACTLPYAC